MPDRSTAIAIAAMALASYGCRAGGYWLFRTLRPPPVVRALLTYLPGTLFVGYVVPALVHAGPPQWVGAAATVAAMLVRRNFLIALLCGTLTAWLVWAL